MSRRSAGVSGGTVSSSGSSSESRSTLAAVSDMKTNHIISLPC
ncbi:Uncharacterised protein [Bordetella pertussis]|nr:Uncharacterised protein [Bordetella pertussis]